MPPAPTSSSNFAFLREHEDLFTDVAGIHVLRPSNDASGHRNTLRETLANLGCPLAPGPAWMKEGDFEGCVGPAPAEALDVEEVATAPLSAHDAELAAQLRKLLPTKKILAGLRDQMWSGTVDDGPLAPILKFATEWDTVDHEFDDPPMEALRRRLHETAAQFRNAFASWMVDDDELFPDGLRLPSHWPAERRMMAITTLQTRAAAVIEAHADLVRALRRRRAGE